MAAPTAMCPRASAEALYEAAPGPKRLLLIEGGTHNNSMRLGRAAYRDALHDFFGLRDDDEAANAQRVVTGAARR